MLLMVLASLIRPLSSMTDSWLWGEVLEGRLASRACKACSMLGTTVRTAGTSCSVGLHTGSNCLQVLASHWADDPS
jgi:hypothetical protein